MGLRWGGHKSCGTLAQVLPHHGRFQGLEAHIVQGNPEGLELRLIGAQQVVVGLWGQSGVGGKATGGATPRLTLAQAARLMGRRGRKTTEEPGDHPCPRRAQVWAIAMISSPFSGKGMVLKG